MEVNLPVVQKIVQKANVEEKPIVQEEPKIATSTKSLDRIREIKEKKKNKFSASVIEQVENKEIETVQVDKVGEIVQVDKVGETVPIDKEGETVHLESVEKPNENENIETLDHTDDKKGEQNYESL